MSFTNVCVFIFLLLPLFFFNFSLIFSYLKLAQTSSFRCIYIHFVTFLKH